jgi:hypothetical protein
VIPSLARALGAEALKLRRTLAIWMMLVTPATVVALQFFGLLRFRGAAPPTGDGWQMLAASVTNLWAAFMLPLFVALETALLAGVEHGARTWKHLYALPVPRWSILAAKLLVAVACVAGAGVALVMLTAAAGQLLRIMKPALGLGTDVPWGILARRVALVSTAALLMTTVHTWLAIRWPSYTAALATGVVGTFVTLFAVGGTLGKYWPWAQPINAIGGTGERLPLAMAIGAGGAVIVAIAAGWDLLRRDVP